MQSLQDFIQHNSIWIFLLCFLWVIIDFGVRCYRHKQTGVVFPHVPPERIRFEERAASGRSYKSMFTKLGGARNCLHVTVTDTEVWIRTSFPFAVFAQQCDLEHRIPRASIINIESGKSAFVRNIILDYRDERGQAHRLSLTLRKPDDFLRAVGEGKR